TLASSSAQRGQPVFLLLSAIVADNITHNDQNHQDQFKSVNGYRNTPPTVGTEQRLEVWERLECLEKTIYMLQESLAQLASRLQPVLCAHPGTDQPTPSDEPQRARSPLSEHMYNLEKALDRSNCELHEMLTFLEL
ncbi:MAG: hypothetical protein GXY58_08065, partial [Planctomycetaceae bacterium]|nr:hypothetical protein [Planctomycetaceae bacterium]